jgi:hypothetical protein
MKVYGPNKTLLKISSSPYGVNTIVYIMFTDSFRNANYSNPISINLFHVSLHVAESLVVLPLDVMNLCALEPTAYN